MEQHSFSFYQIKFTTYNNNIQSRPNQHWNHPFMYVWLEYNPHNVHRNVMYRFSVDKLPYTVMFWMDV